MAVRMIAALCVAAFWLWMLFAPAGCLKKSIENRNKMMAEPEPTDDLPIMRSQKGQYHD